MTEHIDLHTHSTCSDGTLTPIELVDLAARRRLKGIALTDHDTVAGVSEAIRRGKEKNVEILPGIEVSSHHNSTSLHILAYGIDHENPGFLDFVKKLQEARDRRNQAITARFSELGIPINSDELTASAADQIGRPHFARLLVKHKVCQNVQDAFTFYLKRGAPAFVEHERPTADEVIHQIGKAGGLAMLAHPACTDPTLEKIPALTAQLKNMGLAGIEIYYPTHSHKVFLTLQKIASEQDLLPCGGTDFHGDKHSNTPLGGSAKTIRIPAHVWNAIKNRLDGR